ncbi:MAG: hypothetical protein DID90_2727552547 [Candidatus Nitrotoga sp. LAW]|nr:DUF1109 domain-containing protein [Candidatus Nitrotoga sp. HW29]RFC31713.1 MAG: hypothetical protein DID92_2727745722 [Candidatus Nitrotoga sp. SPKER]RFC38919.1 MAG: hypothetical protein DID90_2727552547 [Candidatus Nitrotoga sp. LAW]CAH1904640.1 conserved membrane hypothetical protein [Candidatus Nitrotoga sp. HW29]
MENIDDLINRLAQDTAAVKPAPHPYMLSLKWMGWAATYLLLSLVLSGLRPDLMLKLHQPWFVAEIAVLAGIFIATSVSAALLAFPDLHQMRRLAFTPVVMFALFVLVMFLAWQADNPPAPLPVHSFECTIGITLMSLLPAAWTFFEMRKFASTHYHCAGSIALLSAFSVGALWLRLHEVNDSIMHVVGWHYLPMIVFGIAGLWLGKRMLKW